MAFGLMDLGQRRPMMPVTGAGAGSGNSTTGKFAQNVTAQRQQGGLAGLGASGGNTWIDAATGKMLRVPSNPQEMAEAEMEARNAALTGQDRSVESTINKGTEEITQSEMEAKRQAGQSSAAAGVTNAADMQGGLQALGSAYSGQRANLARDVRARQQDQQRSEDASMFGRIAGYQQAAYGQSQDALAAGKAGGGSSSTFTGPRAAAVPDNVFADPNAAGLSKLAQTPSGAGGFWNKAKGVSKATMGSW